MDLSPHRDIVVSPDILIAPRPALAAVLEHNPDQIMLWPVVNENLSQALAVRCDYRNRRVKL